MLQTLIAGQRADVLRDAADMERDLTRETELEAIIVKSNDYSNRLAGALAGLGADLQALKDEIASGTVSAASLARLDTAIEVSGSLSNAAAALDSGFPVPDPTPVPAPEEETVPPPVEEAPGAEPVPTDGGGDGGSTEPTP